MKSSLPRRSTFCYFCHFCGTISISCGKFLLSRSHRLFHERVFLSHGKNGNLYSALRSLSAISAISAGLLLYHATGFSTKEYFCPTEIKEILLPARCEALSAISALSAGHYYLMRIVFYCPDFYCPAEIKEIQVSDVALGRPSASKLQGQELQKVK